MELIFEQDLRDKQHTPSGDWSDLAFKFWEIALHEQHQDNWLDTYKEWTLDKSIKLFFGSNT